MQFTIDPDHPSLAGHFPGRPIVPGVVLLERVLEAIELTHGSRQQGASQQAASEQGALQQDQSIVLRLPRVKFAQPLLPGEVAEITLDPGLGGRWSFRVQRGDVLLASGEVVVVDAAAL